MYLKWMFLAGPIRESHGEEEVTSYWSYPVHVIGLDLADRVLVLCLCAAVFFFAGRQVEGVHDLVVGGHLGLRGLRRNTTIRWSRGTMSWRPPKFWGHTSKCHAASPSAAPHQLCSTPCSGKWRSAIRDQIDLERSPWVTAPPAPVNGRCRIWLPSSGALNLEGSMTGPDEVRILIPEVAEGQVLGETILMQSGHGWMPDIRAPLPTHKPPCGWGFGSALPFTLKTKSWLGRQGVAAR